MSFKSSTGKLYTLFSVCITSDESVRRRLLICEIMEMKEYRELKYIIGNQQFYSERLSECELERLSCEELNKLRVTLPDFLEAVSQTYYAVLYGNGWSFKSEDFPDIFSRDSVKNFLSKINLFDVYLNKTNITEKDFLSIFDDRTFKSNNPSDDIKARNDVKYCIKGEL
ncbi:MAG TPA: hypothetical protein PKI60_03620 [Oscillospiraceae bacterium]|nr:hypothetical protein [Oscillospiraceae bacterium]